MTSTLKVNTIQNACGADIIKENSNTITIGASGDTVTLGTGASQTGFGRTGTVDWQTTIKTAGFTASDGEGYFLNTNSGGFTVALPAGSAGAIVAFKDYLNTWDTGNVTITPNGSDKIGGVAAELVLSTESQSVTLIFTDSTRGWVDIHDSTTNATGNAFISATGGTVTTSGNDKIHTFTGDGTFTVSKVACSAANNAVAYMVVGGGGYGSDYKSGSAGGGGAGGFREGRTAPITPYTASPLAAACSGLTVTATSFPIQVGAGSASGATNGEPSIFSSITSTGGGRGAAIGGNAGAPYDGANGGSGGGADGEGRPNGDGNEPPTNPPQGNNGGSGRVVGGDRAGGGGGGAGAVGVNGSSPQAGGAGGAGVSTEITGSAVTRAGGGGGQGQTNTAGAGGSGGGGAAGGPLCSAGNPGTINTGGGGGAGNKGTGSGTCGGQGGSGIVVIRYKFQ